MDGSMKMNATSMKKEGGRRMTRGRVIAAISATAAAVLVTLAGAAPAQAATPAFEIFYGPGCGGGGTASRVYTGNNSKEGWVNDTFTSSQWGTTGLGEPIRNDAASIYISNAAVYIYVDGNDSPSWSAASSGACYNLPDGVRNHNTQWQTFSII
jgi:hypothetical protein